MLTTSCRPNVQQEFRELSRPTRAMSSIRDNVAKILCGTFNFDVKRKIRSECEPTPSRCMRRTVKHSMPLGVKHAFSNICETCQATTIETIIRKSQYVSAAHVMRVDPRKILNPSEGAYECAHCIDASCRFFPKKRLF